MYNGFLGVKRLCLPIDMANNNAEYMENIED